MTVAELSAREGIPAAYLKKLMRSLVKSNLAQAQTGAKGGVRLHRSPEEINVLQILEACEGSYSRAACMFYPGYPCLGMDCPVYCPLRREEERIKDSLRGTSLAEVARLLDAHPDRRDINRAPSEWKPL